MSTVSRSSRAGSDAAMPALSDFDRAVPTVIVGAPPGHDLEGEDGTCANFIPLDLRHDLPPTARSLELARDEYRRQLHGLRRMFVILWLVLLVAWGIGLIFVLSGVDDESPGGGTAYLATFTLPVVLVVVVPALYFWMRRGSRVDDLEAEPESGRPDRFPPDRFVLPAGRLFYAFLLGITALVLAALPWGAVALVAGEPEDGVSQGGAVAAAVGSLVLLALLVAVVIRARRVGVAASDDGLVVTTWRRRTSMPWTDVEQVRVELVEVRDQHGTTRSLRLALDTRPLPKTVYWALGTGTSGARARARHNIEVAGRWTREHGVDGSPSLDAGLRWAHGDISLHELESSARFVVPGALD